MAKYKARRNRRSVRKLCNKNKRNKNQSWKTIAKAGTETTAKVNTERIIKCWNAKQYDYQNSNDVWKIIQDEVKYGCFCHQNQNGLHLEQALILL